MSKAVTIEVNDVEIILDTGLSVGDYVMKMGIKGRFIIALNDQLISKTDYSKCLLNDGDRLEILSPITGG
jgi:sulfur carrier protein